MVVGLMIGILAPFLLGNAALYYINKDKILHVLENISLSFLIGQGMLTLIIFWSLFVDLPHRIALIESVLALLLFAAAYSRRKIIYRALSGVKGYLSTIVPVINARNVIFVVILLLLLLKVSYVFVEACSKPEYSWDACMNWTAAGKDLFYLNQSHPGKLAQYFIALNAYYPKQISLMHFWLFNCMGQFNDQWSKVIFPLELVCLLILFYFSAKRLRGSLGAIVFTYLLFSAPLFAYLATIGYADFTLCVYFSLGIIFLFNWINEEKNTWFWLFSIMLGLTAWIKLEGRPLFLLGFLVLLACLWQKHRKDYKRIVISLTQYALPFVIFGLPWQAFIFLNHMQTREKLGWHLPNWIDLHMQIYAKMFAEGSWGLFWILFIAAMVFFYRKAVLKGNLFLLLSIILFYGMLVFIFLFTDDGYGWFNVSFNRVLLPIYPVAGFYLANLIPKIRIRWFGDV